MFQKEINLGEHASTGLFWHVNLPDLVERRLGSKSTQSLRECRLMRWYCLRQQVAGHPLGKVSRTHLISSCSDFDSRTASNKSQNLTQDLGFRMASNTAWFEKGEF